MSCSLTTNVVLNTNLTLYLTDGIIFSKFLILTLHLPSVGWAHAAEIDLQ